ncbi:MAG TPA: signal recognition particle-docking protein FtsY [Bacillota bacterium]|nr:signal recognition particle-docking protein FtsY [Bacillota bacterium]
MNRLEQGLTRMRAGFFASLDKILKRDLPDFSELEESLILADVGPETTHELIDRLKQARQRGESARESLRVALVDMLDGASSAQTLRLTASPSVVVVVGVNGTGKTTTIAKLAARMKEEGRTSVLAAADTYRPAAIDQLQILGSRVGARVVAHQPGSDPAAVAFDAIQAAVNRGNDLVLVDTAGRLHTRSALMDELGKICRVISRTLPGAPHEILLVLDATTGQNAIEQARVFKEAVGVTGVILTKLDGTARGGVVVAVRRRMGLPIRFVGVGEGMDDLLPFDAREFVEALLGPGR